MSKLRVYELAKELDVSSKDLITLLGDEFGIDVKNHMSVIEESDVELVKEMIADTKKVEAEAEVESGIVNEYEAALADSLNVKNKKGKNKPVKKEEEEDATAKNQPIICDKTIEIGKTITVKELSDKLELPPIEVIKQLMFMGVMAAMNQEIDFKTAEKLGVKLNANVLAEEVKHVDDEPLEEYYEIDNDEDLIKRLPVVTVMGHVDHGKTSLLDAIRKAKVTESEAGGITQHIGAYIAEINGEEITFLDTPGHEAFTSMRARGAQITDIVILVVAADDGIMPQTKEAISHCKAAKVPVVVAINKMDKPGANLDRVKQELSDNGLVPEDWGGDTVCVPVSARTKEGIEHLLEMILITAEMMELKSNPNRHARGTVVEANLDKGRGPVATLLIQDGTLKVGDSIIVGNTYGRIRAMFDHLGKKVKSAGPSVPVEILGLSEVPAAGDKFNVVKDEKTARNMADLRKEDSRNEYLKSHKVSLEDLYNQIQEGSVKELGLIVKGDMQGSVQALTQSLEKLSTDSIKVRVIHGAVGAITETDVTLASASNAIIIGFHVRPDNNAAIIADKEKVEIKTYRIIYDAIEDVKSAMIGMLDPEYKEVVLGTAEIRNVLKISNVGNVAGSYVLTGKLVRSALVRVIREGIVLQETSLSSLKRFKDDVKEVAAGYECGLTIEKFNDVKEGDIVEAYMMQEIKQTTLK